MDVTPILKIEELFSVPAKKLRYVLLKKEDRKIIHQFLDANYPKLKKRSVYCKKFEIEYHETYKQCDNCKKPVLMEYHTGQMKNNQDEYYSGDCRKCEESDDSYYDGHVAWECNYDDMDGVFRVPVYMKMLVFGDYSYDGKIYKLLDGKSYTEKDVLKILKDKKIYEIDIPENTNSSKPWLTNIQLAWYLYWSLNHEKQGKNKSPKSQLLTLTI